ncbi:MAG: HTH domain-containing protein [Sulfolobales archaeon]
MELKKIIDWILSEGGEFIDARKLAKKFNITTHSAGRVLKNLQKLGYIKIYKKRRGRFTIYKLGDVAKQHS